MSDTAIPVIIFFGTCGIVFGWPFWMESRNARRNRRTAELEKVHRDALISTAEWFELGSPERIAIGRELRVMAGEEKQ